MKTEEEKMFLEELEIFLIQQHKNTRHDAVEKICEIRARWEKTHNFSVADNMMNEITGAIMNLKQRKPETE